MTIISIIIAICAIFFALNQRRLAVETRKNLSQYAARMEAAELDLHAVRGVVARRLSNAGLELKASLEKPDHYYLEELANDLIEVQNIVETRGPATIGGRPFWDIEPQENHYHYGVQYPLFPK